ncbi:MAG TPA: diadenylate cyclase CdaA [Candidatus Acidoferrales bacterium]|nr:diadenylate cyclase CdaA [Candidatus Acidoferrales bacterium]
MSWVSTLFSYIGITDVIDIVATAVLIYYVLLLIRGTRAVQMITGLFVLAGLLGLANLLHLYLLGAILQWLVIGAAVTLPIIFQPELRRALEQIGRGGLLHIGDETTDWMRPEDKTITTLARAAFLLSRNKLGGLIVIEQQSGLKEFTESGTALHAELSEELLLTIFMPRSPLHDGAVIVRENTIEAAACFLPLAEQRLAGRRIGTRHRAALGLTEQTDAVIIVISEETGAISIAREGKLSRPLEEEARLVKVLLAVTRPARDRRGFVRNDIVSQLRARIGPPKDKETVRADHPKELRT